MTSLDEQLHAYVREHFSDHDELLAALMPAAQEAGLPQISISLEEGRLFQLLLRAIGARKVLEIGTLGGYSAITMARALPSDGKLVTLERSGKHAAFAREWIARAGLDDIIEVREGAALDTLPHLASEAPFDAVFIDANKEDYPQYLEYALRYTRVGGLIIAHNAFLQGKVVGASDDRSVVAMQEFNRRFANEPHLLSTMLFGGDGIAVGLVTSS